MHTLAITRIWIQFAKNEEYVQNEILDAISVVKWLVGQPADVLQYLLPDELILSNRVPRRLGLLAGRQEQVRGFLYHANSMVHHTRTLGSSANGSTLAELSFSGCLMNLRK